MEKLNEATLLGWRVLRFTPEQVMSVNKIGDVMVDLRALIMDAGARQSTVLLPFGSRWRWTHGGGAHMRSHIESEHWNDANGNPAGGNTFGPGFAIGWQHGPLGRGAGRRAQNGAFVEDVIAAAADRIRYYQSSRFACDRNANALAHLEAALAELEARTESREARGVEGTHDV